MEKPLKELIDLILIKEISGNVDASVTGLVYHTDKVEEGNLFFALPGTRSRGWEYAGAAKEKGAVAMVAGMDAPEMDMTLIKTPDVRMAMALLSSAFYDYPAQKMQLIGVTGTNGKTTTTYLINELLRYKNLVTGLIGTVDYKVADETMPPLSTTPEANDLQRLFSYMLTKKVSHVVMEVSSHALEWHRVSGSEYDTAVLTNVTADHLDFHLNFDSYLAAKTKMFSRMGGSFVKNGKPKVAVLNRDDPSYEFISARTPVQQITYGINKKADVFAEAPVTDLSGIRYKLKTFAGETEINLKLRGKFNIYNSLAAIAVALTEGLSLEDIKVCLESVNGVPGRFEQVECGQDFLVIIDYAHTADGLENVLDTARALLNGGRIITVFGCGGERDRTKRPIMGEIAGKYSDFCIVTSDNPRGEDAESIIKDIIPGLEKEKTPGDYFIAVDRYDAIKKAVETARKGDIVMIAGKGHEDYQIFKDKTVHFSDREVVSDLLSAKNKFPEIL